MNQSCPDRTSPTPGLVARYRRGGQMAAYRYATAAGRDLLAADEGYADLSNSTAADDATADQLNPLGA